MFLKSIHLKNFKCFDDIELSFAEEDGAIRKWTLLLGENGTGKSALLKAIALVTRDKDALFELLTDPDDWIRHGEKECTIAADLKMESGKIENIRLKIKRTKFGESRFNAISHNAEVSHNGELPLFLAGRELDLVIGYGASRRLSSRESWRLMGPGMSRVTRANNVATLFDPDVPLIPLENWAIDLDYRRENGMDFVQNALDDFLPDEIRFHKIDKRGDHLSEPVRLLFKTPDGIVPLRSLSDGYQCVAAWVGDLLYRITSAYDGIPGAFDNYRSPLKVSGLLLIDEVDLHLHPKWQRELLSRLREHLPNFQVIATTHSPMTAQQADVNQLHYMTRQDGRIEIEQFTGNPRSLLINQLLMTDVFGLESDESLEVQEKKNRYSELRDKEPLSPDESREFDQLKTYLSERPTGGRSNMRLQKEEKELLQQVMKELQERKS